MGDQVEVDLIVKAIATGFDKLSKGFIDVEKANKDAAGALSTFGVNLNALDNPITAVAQGIKASISANLEWAGSMDKLSRNTGLTTEEASRLAVVAGDVGIEIGTLERSLKSMTKQGLELNFETLKKVSAEYNAATSPVDRMRIATKAFGASAQDMTEILSRTPEELDQLAKSAENSGKIMTAEGVAKAEKFEQSLAQLQDRIEGLKIVVGGGLVDTLLKAGDAFQNELKIVALAAIEFQRMTGQIDYNEAAQRAAEVAAGDYTAAVKEQYVVVGDNTDAHERAAASTETLTADQIALDAQTRALNSTWQGYSQTVADGAVTAETMAAAQEHNKDIADKLAFSMGDLNKQMIFAVASQGLSADAQFLLAEKMGLVNAGAAAEYDHLQNLKTAYDINKDGLIDLTEAAAGYANAANNIALAAIFAHDELVAMTQEAQNATGGVNGQVGGATGDGYDANNENDAVGTPGIMTVPPGYNNDGYRIGVSSGEQYAVAPPGKSLREWIGGGGGQVVNNFYITNPDPHAVAMEVSHILGAQADARMRI